MCAVFLLLLSLWYSVVVLHAQESSDAQERQGPPLPESSARNVTQLQPVVVTATRTQTPVQETAASITVVGEEEIQQQQATTVSELLRSVPGINVSQSGSRGTTTSVFTRGASSNQTLVLIDGVEVNSVTLGSFDFSNLSTENIDRIEVLRGGGDVVRLSSCWWSYQCLD